MKSVTLNEQAPEAILFVGSRSLHNEGMRWLTAEYAASYGMRLFHSEGDTGDCVIPPRCFSLMVCCPPCWTGLSDWLSALLTASQYRSERAVVYLDSSCPAWRRALVFQMLRCPHSVVYDSDTPDCIVRMLGSRPPVSGLISATPQLTDREAVVVRGYLQGISVQSQSRGLELSVGNIYRLRLSGLNKLGLRPRMRPSGTLTRAFL